MAEQDNENIFKRLRKLFATNVIVRNVAGGKKLKVIDTDDIQAYMSNVKRDKYSRLYTSGYDRTGMYDRSLAYQSARLELFRDYDTMDQDPILASALDIYADESTVKNEYGDVLTIKCDDERVKDILHNLFYDILNIEFNLWWWVRNMCKYGDCFLFMEISPDYGIHNVIPMSIYETTREEGTDPNNPYYVRFRSENLRMGRAEFENYEIAHFRLLTDSNFLPYGRSMIEPARRTWKQLMLMEDAMMIHRIMRAPDKRVFKVDIGNLSPADVEPFMVKMIDKMKRVPLLDPKTGDYNLRFNMQNITEDFFLPVRGGDSGTNIETLSGLQYAAIEDIEYLRNRMMSALKIPKSFFGYEEGLSGKATLAAEDVRFARTVERIQRIIVSELTKIAVVHLYAQGFTDQELVSFSLELTNPSTIYEQEKINLWKEKVSLAGDMMNSKLISSDWIYQNVLGFTDVDINENRRQVLDDIKRAFRYSQIEQGQNDPAQGAQNPAVPEAGGEEASAAEAGGEGGADEAEIEKLAAEVEAELESGEAPVEETRMGRPPRIGNYGTDDSPRGRDPLGYKENRGAMRYGPQRKASRRRGLSVESYEQMLMSMDDTKRTNTKLLKEDTLTDDENQ